MRNVILKGLQLSQRKKEKRSLRCWAQYPWGVWVLKQVTTSSRNLKSVTVPLSPKEFSQNNFTTWYHEPETLNDTLS
jgi:hypothetical protein